MAVTLPYPNMDFTPLDVLTAAEMDQMVANDKYLADFCAGLADGTNIGNGMIPLSKLNNKYTTDEEIIGKWEDGKTIYRKVIKGTGHIPASTKFAEANVVNTVVFAHCEALSDYDEWRPIPWLYGNSANSVDGAWHSGFSIRPKLGDITFQVGSAIGKTKKWHVIVEYTKV